MLGLMSINSFSYFTLAQATGAAPAQSGGPFSFLVSMFPLLLIVVIMYFLMIRPQQKKQKAHQSMISSIKAGDEVVAAGGLYGTVAGIDEKRGFIWLKIANDSKIKVERFSVVRVLTDEEKAG
jgi:preprotein translocase subunit YajC